MSQADAVTRVRMLVHPIEPPLEHILKRLENCGNNARWAATLIIRDYKGPLEAERQGKGDSK